MPKEHNRDQVVEGKRLGVESTCTTLSQAGLQVAASTYYAAKTREPSARARRARTTRRDDTAARHPELVKRAFTATAPNQLGSPI